MRLNVGPFRAKQFAQPVNRKLLGLVDELAPAVITFAGKALGVLVGEDASLRGHHSFAGVILGSDELCAFDLADALTFYDCGDFRISL